MSLLVQELPSISRVILPAVYSSFQRTPFGKISRLVSDEQSFQCSTIEALASERGKITTALVRCENSNDFMLGKPLAGDLFAPSTTLHLAFAKHHLADGVLTISKPEGWLLHPHLVKGSAHEEFEFIWRNWDNAIQLVEEIRDQDGHMVRPGLRPPQIGALHALAAHRTVSTKPSLIVMPTGTGKTEVMIASMLMMRPKHLLVLVPTDALRVQTARKFARLGVLREARVLSSAPSGIVLNPTVAIIEHSSKDDEGWETLPNAHVTIATVAVLQGMKSHKRRVLLERFDAVFFDEAHHVKAASWEAIYQEVEVRSNVAMFTATPFRLDGLRLPGKIIYDFPLRLAQEQKYFRRIQFREVWEFGDKSKADCEIAAKAVDQLRADRAKGYKHILMARADTQERAERLFQEIYSAKYADCNPVVIHSGTRGRKRIEEDIRSGKHQIIVCVDMFGEGFDLPTLKIAALHDRHQSLAITLQFTGRFTRDATDIGDPTLVANLGDENISDAIEGLYAENADWNELIPQLSAQAIESQMSFSEFLERMDHQSSGDEHSFGLNVLHPKMSTLMYRGARSFQPQRFRKSVKKTDKLIDHWTSKDRDMLVFITKSRLGIEWARVKDETDIAWNLYVVAHDAKNGLLFIHSSAKGSLHLELAESVGGKDVKIIDGEQIFRAFHGIERLTFHNVGLHYRGSTKQRFRMSTGLDVGEAITPIEQSGATKCNLFAVGYDAGKRVSVGGSAKGRIWSMRSCSIPDWWLWCGEVARKVLDESISHNSFLDHTLIPREIDSLPYKNVFGVFMPHQWYGSEMENTILYSENRKLDFHGFGILDHRVLSSSAVVLTMGWDEIEPVEFQLGWGPNMGDFAVTQPRGVTVEVQRKGGKQPLASFFRENPPSLLLGNGAEVTGGQIREPRKTLAPAFERNEIQALDWDGIDLTCESKWKHGHMRSASIQGRVIEKLLKEDSMVIFDDDDANEAADVVEIVDDGNHLVFRLYHCKFAGGKEPSRRVKDLETVCNQAVRSVRWANDPEFLLSHLKAREGDSSRRGRLTRFERGDLKTLSAVRRLLKKRRHRFEVFVVQPGLSRKECDAELASMLGAASTFIFQVTNLPLRVWASA